MHDEIPASYRLVPVESCSKEIDPVLSSSKQEGSRNGCDDDDDDGLWVKMESSQLDVAAILGI